MAYPRISIITPSYNQARFLEATITSVLSQGYPDLEYVIIDGGSTDESVSIIENYDEHLAYWTSEPDSGQTDALNKGFARATGDILGFLNSDDVLLPGALHRVVQQMERLDAKWLVGGCRYVSETDSHTWVPEEVHSVPHWLTGQGGIPQRSTFFQRKLWEVAGDFREDMHYAFDTEYWIRLLSSGFRYKVIEEELAIARLHASSKTVSKPVAFAQEESQIRQIYLPQLSSPERDVYERILTDKKIQEESAICLNMLRQEGRLAACLAAVHMLLKYRHRVLRRPFFGMVRRLFRA